MGGGGGGTGTAFSVGLGFGSMVRDGRWGAGELAWEAGITFLCGIGDSGGIII